MFDALYKHLEMHPHLYLDEMARFLFDEFDILVSTRSIRRALKSIKWTKKKMRRVANKQNADLRDIYSLLRTILEYVS
jgi:GTP1/Obg family GTP-binding protein